MFERIHNFVTSIGIVSGIYDLIYGIVKRQFTGLEKTLSEQSYASIVDMVNKIGTVSLILFLVYILYSLIHFLYSFVFKGKFKLGVLISIGISFPFLILFYVIYAYLNLN